MHSMLVYQNESYNLRLLKASASAYKKAKRWDLSVTGFLTTLALVYPFFYVYSNDQNIRLGLFGCSFILAVMIEILNNILRGNTSKGALFKEEFDTRVFRLPWKSTLMKPDPAGVSKYALLYKGKEIKDWYLTNLSENLNEHLAVAVCQRTNTGWDIDLRKTYCQWLYGILIAYSIGLFAFLVINNVSGYIMFSIGFSILPFYTNYLGLLRGHSSVIEKREAISKRLDDIIFNKKNVTKTELRDIQDEIYLTRQENAKVPDFFFNIYRKKSTAEFEDYIEIINGIYGIHD